MTSFCVQGERGGQKGPKICVHTNSILPYSDAKKPSVSQAHLWPRTNSRIEAGLTKKWIEIKMNCSNDYSWKYRQQFGVENKTLMARLRAVLLISLLILCQNQVKGLDYGCKCGLAKKGTLKGFRTQAATSGPIKNSFFLFPFLFENFCPQLPQET